MPVVKSQLLMVAIFLGSVCEKLDVVCCGAVTVSVLKTLDRMPLSKIGLHYPHTIQTLQLEKFLRKPS